MRPGDHAFLCYGAADGSGAPAPSGAETARSGRPGGSETDGWDVLSAFIWSGLARGEKVLVLPPPGLREPMVWGRLQQAPGLLLATGRTSGQLSLTSMRSLLGTGGDFTAERQWRSLREQTERAHDEGYSGLRCYIDMGWVAELDTRIDVVLDWERRAGHLFADGFYSEICAYHRADFPTDVLDTLCAAHPCNLLPGLGQLRALHGTGSLRLVGEADMATRGLFRQALITALSGATGSAPLTVDLTGLTFLGSECAADLVEALGRGTGGHTVRARCTSRDAALLFRLGAGSAHVDTVPR
ncbi:MEDS domain-containing protein [Streptomyces sp. TS71-3]|uniref:MEDS domain-containing protein n=1 Tax=Streptomyces sp. TS71-3 TaxID=2733862 RepID=UPI001BB426DD|nr:MEDS domain-containing protein [Streptomyces sp. TS71-3]